MKLQGLIAATFTPLDAKGNLNLSMIPVMVDRLVDNGISGIYICGSTGEGHSLTVNERKQLAERFIEAARGRIKTIVNVGHNSLEEVRSLTRHAAEAGADAISAAPPTYYKIGSVEQLIKMIVNVTSAAPELPFYYYHIPAMTGVYLDMVKFLDVAKDRLPSLQGIKFTSPQLNEFQQCVEMSNSKYQILFGLDEMLLGGLVVGADCMIGSTFNFMPALYHEIISSFRSNNMELARQLQLVSVKVIDAFLKFSSLPAQKAIMKMVGLDCGPVRLPLIDLTVDEEKKLRNDLAEAGFFRWSIKLKEDIGKVVL